MAKSKSYMRAYRLKKEPEGLASYTRSADADKGQVMLISNNTIGAAGSYQGTNASRNKGNIEFGISSLEMASRLDELRNKAPKVYGDETAVEALRQLASINGPDTKVTVYRATTGTSINHGDWVFLSEQQADRWARGTFSRKPKPGFRVIKAHVAASQVGYSGKNLEFVIR